MTSDWSAIHARLDMVQGLTKAIGDVPAGVCALAEVVRDLADIVQRLDDEGDLCTKRAQWALLDGAEGTIAYSCTEHLPQMIEDVEGALPYSIRQVKDIVQLGCQYSGGE